MLHGKYMQISSPREDREDSLVPPLGWRNAHKTNKSTGKVGSYHKCAPVDAMGLVSSVFLVQCLLGVVVLQQPDRCRLGNTASQGWRKEEMNKCCHHEALRGIALLLFD